MNDSRIRNHLAFFVCLILLALSSCRQPSANLRDRPIVTHESFQQKYPFPDSYVVEIADSDRPASPEAFRREFIRLFESNIYKPFLELGYWNEASEEQIEEYLNAVLYSVTLSPNPNHGVFKDPSADVEIKTLVQYGDYGYYPGEDEELIPRATHVLGVTVHVGNSIPVTQHYAVGQNDGKFYFCRLQSSDAR